MELKEQGKDARENESLARLGHAVSGIASDVEPDPDEMDDFISELVTDVRNVSPWSHCEIVRRS